MTAAHPASDVACAPAQAGLPPVVLEVQGLSTSFTDIEGEIRPVDDVGFVLRRGRTLAVVGESGCGKSVMALSILRLLGPGGRMVGGRVALYPRGRPAIDLSSLDPRDKRLFQVRGGLITMIFQEPGSALSPAHTIGSQIAEAIRAHEPVSRAEARARTLEMLQRVGIPAPERRFRQYPHELSGGLRQRAVIAMALVCRPEVLIADEPTSSLDGTVQAQTLGLIRELKAELGCALLLITHNMGVVAQLADEVAVMYLGRIVEHGPVEQVLLTPRHPYTIGLMHSVPGVSGQRRRLRSIQGQVPSLSRLPPGCAFHPRCPWAKAGVCDVGQAPALQTIDNRAAACVRLPEIAAGDSTP
jgi:oligopeptide/dipeptide ABC transporter ATP-binding protein